MYAWNQLGRRVKKGEKGIRILAPIIGIKRKSDEEAEKDITKQNTRALVGFRNAYVFDCGADRRRGASRRCERGITAMRRRELTTVFVSFIEKSGHRACL